MRKTGVLFGVVVAALLLMLSTAQAAPGTHCVGTEISVLCGSDLAAHSRPGY